MSYYEVNKNVSINGHKLHLSLKEFKLSILMLIEPHVNVAPISTLQDSMSNMFDLIENFCYMEKYKNKLKGAKKAQLSREISKMPDVRELWENIYDRKTFIKKFYHLVLNLEGLSVSRTY